MYIFSDIQEKSLWTERIREILFDICINYREVNPSLFLIIIKRIINVIMPILPLEVTLWKFYF